MTAFESAWTPPNLRSEYGAQGVERLQGQPASLGPRRGAADPQRAVDRGNLVVLDEDERQGEVREALGDPCQDVRAPGPQAGERRPLVVVKPAADPPVGVIPSVEDDELQAAGVHSERELRVEPRDVPQGHLVRPRVDEPDREAREGGHPGQGGAAFSPRDQAGDPVSARRELRRARRESRRRTRPSPLGCRRGTSRAASSRPPAPRGWRRAARSSPRARRPRRSASRRRPGLIS